MMNGQKPQIYEFDSFRLDAAERQFLRDGKPLTIPAKAFDLLLVLIENNGRLVSKDELYNRVWQDQIVEESNLTVQISAIRKALGEQKSNPRFLTTVPGRGYRFTAEVLNSVEEDEVIIETETLSRITIEEESRDAETRRRGDAESELRTWNLELGTTKNQKPKTKDQSPPRHHSLFLLSGACVLVLLLLGSALYLRQNSSPTNQTRAAALPFANAKIRQLTTKGRVGHVAVSPDGEFYAYSLAQRGEHKNSLWIGQTAGGKDIELRPPDDNMVRGLDFSPDGKTLYFSLSDGDDSKGGFYKMPVLGGVAEKISDDISANFRLSPDGKQVAYLRRSKEQEEASALVVVNADGTGGREIATRPRSKHFSSRGPAWSPDGSRLAVGAINDSEKQSHEVFIVRVTDGHTGQLTSLDWINVQNLVWQGDGRGLIIVGVDKGEVMRHHWYVDLDGSAHRISQDTDSYGLAISISANGDSLAAVQLKSESNIWVAPSDDLSKARQVTFSSINGKYGWQGVEWTPDGRIVFLAGIDRTNAIYSMDADGGNIRQITSAGFYDYAAKVTADGRFVVFHSNRSGSSEIWRVRLDGSDLQQLTTGGGNIDPHTTPDGKWVVYNATRDGKSFIYRVSIDGGEAVQITDKSSSNPHVSPDGKFIACGYKADAQSQTQLAIVNFVDGTPVKLFDVPRSANFNNSIRWTPDGKAICYRDWANGIWKQSLSGGEPVRLEGLPEEKLYMYGWSRDGKLFAFARGREISDAVLIRNAD